MNSVSTLWRLALHSAWSRRFVLGLIVFSLALSSFLLLSIERLRQDVRWQFAQSVSGTDLIVGARTGSVQLLLYSVFRMGSASNNIRWSSVQELARQRAVAWTVPIALGDSHRGFAVVGTTPGYFEHFRYGEKQALAVAQGRVFTADAVANRSGVYEAVIGADVAERLGYVLGQSLILSHGDGALSSNDHRDKPFTVVGILARTGTPVDRSVHIPLEGITAMHLDWVAGVPLPGSAVSAADALAQDLTPRSVTAVLVGLQRRTAVFGVQRWVSQYDAEPLMAVLPGVALDELWEVVGPVERALLGVSVLVGVVSVAGLMAVILAGLDARRRELAILRSVGVGPRHVLGLLALEGAVVTGVGVLLGAAVCLGAVFGLGPVLQAHWGVVLQPRGFSADEWTLLAGLWAAGVVASLVPGYRAYRLSLADGLSPRV